MPSGAGSAPGPHRGPHPGGGIRKRPTIGEIRPDCNDRRAPLQEVLRPRLSGAAEWADLVGAGHPIT
eukprot:1802937-Lingulodinium_polyedra.AAC.1